MWISFGNSSWHPDLPAVLVWEGFPFFFISFVCRKSVRILLSQQKEGLRETLSLRFWLRTMTVILGWKISWTHEVEDWGQACPEPRNDWSQQPPKQDIRIMSLNYAIMLEILLGPSTSPKLTLPPWPRQSVSSGDETYLVSVYWQTCWSKSWFLAGSHVDALTV